MTLNDLKRKVYKLSHNAHNPLHCLYLFGVSVEAGKNYAYIAAVLLCVTVVDHYIAHGSNDHKLEPEDIE